VVMLSSTLARGFASDCVQRFAATRRAGLLPQNLILKTNV